MKFNKIIFFIFTLILSVSIRLLAQEVSVKNLALQKHFADSLFSSGNYYEAITEYKRLKFFDKENQFQFHSDLQIAIAYKNGGFYQQSEKYFDKALDDAETIENKELAEIELAKMFIVSGQSDKALNLLDKIETGFTSPNKINYWKGWAYVFNGSFNLASNYFTKSNATDLAKIVSAYSDSLYSVKTAKILSYIFPGAGQFYTEEYFSGLMSLAWNALWIYVTADAFIDGRILEGFLIGDLLWLRFYRGNIYNAEKFANEKNVKLINRFLNYLQNNYKGEMP